MQLIHDIPHSTGVQNGLKRARRLTEAQFTPIRPFPIVTVSSDANGKRTYHEDYAAAYFPRKGLPYSSVRRVEKYIGYNVSFETFLSALTNPDSVVYTRPITGTGDNVHNHYGIVCSCFASEVLDIPYRTPCVKWPEIPGVAEVPAEPLENLQLLDLLLVLQGGKHIAVITDIERDEEGIVRYITVSESVLPFCRVTRFTPEEFRGYWFKNNYHVYRYNGVDRITYEPDPFLPIEEDGPIETPKINRILMTDYGNKANYRLGEKVLISVFDPAYTELAMERPDGTVAHYPVEDGKCVLCPALPGFYSVRAIRGTEESDPVLFCITDLRFVTDKPFYAPGEKMKVRFENSADDKLVAWQFNRCDNDRGCGGGFFADPVIGTGIELTAPAVDAEAVLYLMARNAYGVYTSERIVVKK